MNAQQQHMDTDRRWQACTEKDASFDGQFVLGVHTTRIYCRPSCPARTPLRKNISFFASPAAAEASGLRACKRCLPREGAAPNAADELARQAATIIQQTGQARLSDLSAKLHISPFHLQRTFKKIMGISPAQFARAHRIKTVKRNLKDGLTVTNAIYDAGFNNSSSLYAKSASMGMTPSTYQRGGRGMCISYTFMDCAFGRMLVAGTARGLCAVYFGEHDEALLSMMHDEYPAAEVATQATVQVMHWANGIAQIWSDQKQHVPLAQLPLDVQGTAFQARVWQAIRAIPSGSTRNYTEIARDIGEPTATRAVANACGANRVAVVIPCHRVIRSDGKFGGYRWGIDRKEQLLALERQ